MKIRLTWAWTPDTHQNMRPGGGGYNSAGLDTSQELAEPFDVSLPAISRHLKVLERAGLITRGKDAQRRPCSLRGESLGAVVEWAEHTKDAWESRFDRLDGYLREMQHNAAKEKKHGRKKQ